jgi:hypothetical protein
MNKTAEEWANVKSRVDALNLVLSNDANRRGHLMIISFLEAISDIAELHAKLEVKDAMLDLMHQALARVVSKA